MLQKIIAFENGFETLMGIVQAEGYSEGGTMYECVCRVVDVIGHHEKQNTCIVLLVLFRYCGSRLPCCHGKLTEVQ